MMAASVGKKDNCISVCAKPTSRRRHTHIKKIKQIMKIPSRSGMANNLSDVVKKFEEEQAMVSLKKKGQLLGFWSSLPYTLAEENITSSMSRPG